MNPVKEIFQMDLLMLHHVSLKNMYHILLPCVWDFQIQPYKTDKYQLIKVLTL